MAQYKVGMETKSKIIEVCRKLFYEKGYTETTYKDIASLVGIKDASIVYHFPQKSDIYSAVYSSAMGKCSEEVRSYITKNENKEYLAFMLYYYILGYKNWHDENYRRFMAYSFNMANSAPYTFYNDYFSRFDLVNVDEFMKENALKLRSCYFMDIGFNKDVGENFNYYSENYTFIEVSTHTLLMYAKIFDMPSELVNRAFSEIREILNRVDWEKLDTRL